jgi:hypothetical protein
MKSPLILLFTHDGDLAMAQVPGGVLRNGPETEE